MNKKPFVFIIRGDTTDDTEILLALTDTEHGFLSDIVKKSEWGLALEPARLFSGQPCGYYGCAHYIEHPCPCCGRKMAHGDYNRPEIYDDP